MWDLDRNNPEASNRTVDDLRMELNERHGVDEYTVEYLLARLAD